MEVEAGGETYQEMHLDGGVCAPLFIAQSERRSAAEPVQRGGNQDDVPTAPIARDVSAIVPQSGGLFVARNRVGQPQ